MKTKTIMKKRKVTGKQLKDFIRGGISFRELAGEENDPDFVIITGGDGYKITLEDLSAGLRHYLEVYRCGTLDFDDFFDYWVLTQIYAVGDLVCLPEMVGQPEKTAEDLDFNNKQLRKPFIKNRKELANYVYSCLLNLEGDRWDINEEPALFEEELQDLLEVIDNYPENEGKRKSDWKLTEKQIRHFVYGNSGDNALKGADDETITLWKTYLEELAAQDDVTAVKILGYACYGDDHYVYSCDWVRSRDCMLKLMEIADDKLKAQAANTLGYIYYYGRTNKGIPDYETAYKYFSLAAFFGYYEAIYKVGDMIMAGKGTPKNETAAFHLYQFVYNDCYQTFLYDGIGSQFADAALRLGGACQNGKGTQQDLMSAYEYYLQARIAIDNRMKRSDFFGDTAVSASIRNAISEVKQELGSACRQKKQDIYLDRLAEELVFAGVKEVQITVDRKKTETHITFLRKKDNVWGPKPNILVTLPEISYCRLSPEVKVAAPAKVAVEVFHEQGTFKADKVKTILKNQEIHFYYRKKLVMAVEMEGWYIKAEREKGSNKMHRFAGVCFEGSERVYDYLCDGIDVKPGDYVIVTSYDGPVKVKVVRVYEQSEADAPLDITKYKKIDKLAD